MIDYPAAHSMDTEWFAVDADGNIGFFNSSEGGAVPRWNQQLKGNDEIVRIQNGFRGSINSFFRQCFEENGDRPIALNIPSEVIFTNLGIDLENLDLEALDEENIVSIVCPSRIDYSSRWNIEISSINLKEPYPYARLHWFVVPCHDEDQFLKTLKHHASSSENYLIRFSGDINLLYINKCPISTIRILLQKGFLKYVIHIDIYNRILAPLFGLFAYEENYHAPFPYDREGIPTHPIDLNDLPEKMQDKITWHWFDRIRFSKSRKVQPIEHMPCDTWGGDKWWVDTQGNEQWGHPEYPVKF